MDVPNKSCKGKTGRMYSEIVRVSRINKYIANIKSKFEFRILAAEVHCSTKIKWSGKYSSREKTFGLTSQVAG